MVHGESIAKQKHDSSTSRESNMPEGRKLLKRIVIVATEKGVKQHVHRAETRALPTKILWALYHRPPSCYIWFLNTVLVRLASPHVKTTRRRSCMTVNGATCRDGAATRRWFARLSLWDVPSGCA
jgi:hypothetical protein